MFTDPPTITRITTYTPGEALMCASLQKIMSDPTNELCQLITRLEIEDGY